MIPFPKLHIAASTLNRIFNTLEGEPQLNLPQPMPMPPIDPIGLGQDIDNKVGAPVMAAEPPPGKEQQTDDAMVAESAQGGSPFDGALVGATTNAF